MHLSRMGAVVVALLCCASAASAQHEGHQGPATKTPRRSPEAAATGDLRQWLRASDASLRVVEKAVEQSDGRTFEESLADLLEVMGRVEDYFEASGEDDGRRPREAARAEKALARQISLLGRLSTAAAPGFRDGLRSALDACHRAREAAMAAAVLDEGEAEDGGHHGRRRSGFGCGHH